MPATTTELRLATGTDSETFEEERGAYLLGVATRRVENYMESDRWLSDGTVEDIIVQAAARVYTNPGYATSTGLADESIAFGEYATQGIRLTGMERADLDRVKKRGATHQAHRQPWAVVTREDYTMRWPS